MEGVGAVGVGGPVDVGDADLFERLEVVVVEVFRAVEHEVLEQVREAGLAELFVLRADVIPQVDRDDGRFVVFMDDERQAVVEDELFVGDVDVGGLRRGQGCK